MSRKVAVTVLFLLGCLAAAAPAFAQAAPPASPQADEVTALVDRAAAAIDAKGKSIFPDFHEAGGPWRSGPSTSSSSTSRARRWSMPPFRNSRGPTPIS
jgi:hypothetical protein